MSKKERDDSGWESFRILLWLALIASAVALVVAVSTNLSEKARAVFIGVLCTLGAIITIVMLVVLVRQANGTD